MQFSASKCEVNRPTTSDEGQRHDALELDCSVVRNRSVVGCRLDRDGNLTINFDAGLRVVIESDQQYESWQLTGDNGERVVCMPGGSLGIWGPISGPPQ